MHETLKREEYEESESALAIMNLHFLDQVSDKGLYKTTPSVSLVQQDQKQEPAKIKQRLNVTVAISGISNIDPIGQSFGVKYRLYMFWEVNLHSLGLRELAEKALATGHYYSMTRSEIEELEGKYSIPKITLFNEISTEEVDKHDIRIYGGREGMTALMWNQLFSSTCKESFELQDFPFDWQELTLDLRLNDSTTWNDFDLTVNTVQFHLDALQLTEFQLYTPIVKRDSPKERATKVYLQVKRLSGFYLQNVVAMMFVLTLLGLLAFAMDIGDLGSRVSTVLTLILTAVAFKFILAGTLPKVPYNCLIDYFMLSQFAALAIMACFCVIPSLIDEDGKYDAVDLNTYLAIISACGVVLVLLVWLIYAAYYIQKRHQRKSTEIVPKPNKNWYSCRYSSPSFLIETK